MLLLLEVSSVCSVVIITLSFEPRHDKTQQSECVPSEDSDQPGHPPSLIRVFAVHMKKAWVLNYPLSAQRRLWSDWADAQADLSLHWVYTHWFCHVVAHFYYSAFLKVAYYYYHYYYYCCTVAKLERGWVCVELLPTRCSAGMGPWFMVSSGEVEDQTYDPWIGRTQLITVSWPFLPSLGESGSISFFIYLFILRISLSVTICK